MPDIIVEEMNATLAELARVGIELERRKLLRSIALRQDLEVLAYQLTLQDAN